MKQYRLIDSGNGRKWEQFGAYSIVRPASQAVWEPKFEERAWQQADASFTREQKNGWTRNIQGSWKIEVSELIFQLETTDFGHLGIFPEQQDFWKWIQQNSAGLRVLNLFAYSGGSTLAAAKGGAHVCHLDASKGMVAWARENAALNQLEEAPIRWIVDDALKFVVRELRRGSRYDAIILDPPTFGRGAKGEIFKIEEHLLPFLKQCRVLLSERPRYVLFSCHTPGFSPIVMKHLLEQTMEGFSGKIDFGEMVLKGDSDTFVLPSGTYARWSCA